MTEQKPLCVINDTHVGAIRTGGTTPTTAAQLRIETKDALRRLVMEHCLDGDLIINGDLFDQFMIPMQDLWDTVEIFNCWMRANPRCRLYVARGNHDIAKNSTMMSSFDLFCAIMRTLWPDGFTGITEPTVIPDHDAYVVPHMPNQDLFNEALKAVPKCRLLFVHANYDNCFAVEADHSLNVSPEQARELPVDFIVFGHEHQRRTELNGKVVIVGNQLPTSVADCLGNDAKYLLKVGGVLKHLPVWTAAEDFLRPDWRNLTGLEGVPQRFIRVEGDATAAEASAVVEAISRFRSRSKALVITNAVKIDGKGGDEEDFKLSLEEAKSFDVMAALLSLLDPEEAATVKELMKENEDVPQA